MLRMYEQKQVSEFENLYDRLIPEDHMLRQIADLVDFSFVIDESIKEKFPHFDRQLRIEAQLFRH